MDKKNDYFKKYCESRSGNVLTSIMYNIVFFFFFECISHNGIVRKMKIKK